MRLHILVVTVMVGGIAAPASAQRRTEPPGQRPTRPGGQTSPTADTPTRSPGTRSPGPGPAAALDQLRTRCQAEIERREAALRTMRTRIDAGKALSEADRAALRSQVEAQSTELGMLKDTIRSDADLASMRQDCKAIVSGFRTYVLMEPKIRLLGAAARVSAVVQRLRTLLGTLQGRIDEAAGAGRDVGALQAALDEARARVEAAAGAVKDVSPTVVPLTPEGYPGNRQTLVSVRQSLKTARDNLAAAIRSLKAVVSGLKASGGPRPEKTRSP